MGEYTLFMMATVTERRGRVIASYCRRCARGTRMRQLLRQQTLSPAGDHPRFPASFSRTFSTTVSSGSTVRPSAA
ncbi:hypothetical protein GCM10009574_070760 [Streptomyces asiaticus]